MQASITEIWRFFGKTENCQDLKAFRDEWAQLTEQEKDFFKVEVGKAIKPE